MDKQEFMDGLPPVVRRSLSIQSFPEYFKRRKEIKLMQSVVEHTERMRDAILKHIGENADFAEEFLQGCAPEGLEDRTKKGYMGLFLLGFNEVFGIKGRAVTKFSKSNAMESDTLYKFGMVDIRGKGNLTPGLEFNLKNPFWEQEALPDQSYIELKDGFISPLIEVGAAFAFGNEP